MESLDVMERKHSVPIDLLRAMLVAAERHRVEVPLLLQDAGLAHLEAKISDLENQDRIGLEDLGALLRSLWQELGDEASGFLTRPLKIGTFGMMCHALITSGNLRRALLRSGRYISLLTDDLTLELVESGTEAKLLIHYDNPHGLDESFFITSIFVIWIRLACWMIDQPMLLERINFRFDAPRYQDEFAMMFPCHHAFSQNENSVVFNRRLLALPIQQNPETLIPFLGHAPESLLTQFRADDSLSAQVKRMLLPASGEESGQSAQSGIDNLSFDEVSANLNMTTHTLRRRLKEEGNSFQEIKDSLRRDQALRLLQRSEKSVHEIADILGFSESAAFNRAFKKWTGKTPGAYRDFL